MSSKNDLTSQRKKEHIELCLTDKVQFNQKSNGFENYEFRHFALTEVDLKSISFEAKFFGKKIKYPFLISCMTGGVSEAENINARLSKVAEKMNIVIGVGSQRQAVESDSNLRSYRVIRENAPTVPILGNIGAAQVSKIRSIDSIKKMVDMIDADAMVIHLNPLQELLQPEGQTDFKGLLKKIKLITRELNVPVIVKEVGSGISNDVAKILLDSGVKGIDIAGAGGTSWAGVELLRSKNASEKVFWDWGLPTSYCIKEVVLLKKNYNFILIGSGGINSAVEMSKAFALGADITASARIILQTLITHGEEKVISIINEWFNVLRKIMFLTGSENLKDLKKNKLVRREELS